MPAKAGILARRFDWKQDTCFRRHDMEEVSWLITTSVPQCEAGILARHFDWKQDACFRRHDVEEVSWLIATSVPQCESRHLCLQHVIFLETLTRLDVLGFFDQTPILKLNEKPFAYI